MKKIMVIALICVLIGLSMGWLLFHTSATTGSADEKKILYYRDPMNPQITSPLPKKSLDGMDFVAVYAEESTSQNTQRIAYYQDPMHPWYTSAKPGKAPDCGMDLVPVYEEDSDLHGIKIDPVTVQNIGIKTEKIAKRRLTRTIRTTGKIDYDERKVYTVNTKIMGWVEKLYVDYSGQLVHKGDPLMAIYSPELVSTQQEYLQAIHYRSQLSGSDREEVKNGAEDLVQSARRRLLYWDIPESEIIALEERGTTQKTMTINSPVDGVVIDKMVWQGQNVMAGMTLYKIADLSTLWILADIYESELSWVQVGQKAEIELSYLPAKSFRGTVSYIYPYLSAETRTARVRIQISNTPDRELKPEMFVTVKLISPLSIDAVTVPEQAVIRSGERNIIVISLGGGYFDPREVKLGITADGYTQIIEGVYAGEVIVTSSQFLIDSESNLKAAITAMRGHEDLNTPEPAAVPLEKPVQVTAPLNPDDPAGHTMPMPEEKSKRPQPQHVTDKEKSTAEQQPVGDQQNQAVYTCVMHPQIRSDKPGDCPLCGMKLVPVPADSTGSKHIH
jgi:membrane fusion protein, copper/silver efflux system